MNPNPSPGCGKPTAQFRLVVFDLDGTLVDSRRDLAESVNQLLVERGAAALDEETVGRMVGDGAATLVARALAASGVPFGSDALSRFLAIYDSRLLLHTRPYPGIPDVLAKLSGRVSLALLTNKPLAATSEILAGLELTRFFPSDLVRCGDGPLPRKPDPAGLLQIAADAGMSPSTTLLVGDSIVDWRTGRAAGTPVCLARYGFGFEGLNGEDLADAAYQIDAPGDLLAIV